MTSATCWARAAAISSASARASKSATEDAAGHAVEHRAEQRGDGEGQQEAEPDQRVEGGEGAAPQLVLHVRLEDGEAEHVYGPGAQSQAADEEHGDDEVGCRRRDGE